ncbi:hypothetical protein [Pengzhenrongella sp.]|uniref:hypothetical protein n=1 Tax=Pengzhenrongella sp. TaxID=2888820 RepID=UPI002F94AC81
MTNGKKLMEAELERTDAEHRILFRLSEDELLLLANSVNEAIQAIKDWEFPIRLGVDKSAARKLRDGLQNVIAGLPGAE